MHRSAPRPTHNRARTTTSRNPHEARESVASTFVPLAVHRIGHEPFWGQSRTFAVDAVQISEVIASKHVVERTEKLLTSTDTAYYKASLQISGSGLLVQDGHEAVLQPGSFAVYDTTRPYSLLFEEDIRMLVLMFPREYLGLPPELVSQLLAHRFSSKDGLGAMIIPFLRDVSENLDQVGGSTGPRLVHAAVDLITTMFADELDIAADSRDSHQMLMMQIRQFIDLNLGMPGLSPDSIARAHFISTRHLHALFRETGTTVSTWIREQRLERCRRDLTDPLSAHLTIGAIAAKWGFVEAPHFSRVFRTAYGVAPSEMRAQSMSSF